MISASVILDSISPAGQRLTTMKLRYPKFVHGEFMTHRVFSRNASSSRAIPVSKNIEEAGTDSLRAEPVFWGAEQKGMSPSTELSDDAADGIPWTTNWETGGTALRITPRQAAKELWLQAAKEACIRARQMQKVGAHKSIINRILEPFLHINVLVSATEWDNFFGLRLDTAAEPTMRALANAMWLARASSLPTTLQPGWWHLPFADMDEIRDAREAGTAPDDPQLAIKISVARCARVSYESFETGKRSTIEEDLRLYNRLVGAQPIHASPAEHQATPDEQFEVPRPMPTPPNSVLKWRFPYEHGNFVGWRQYRKLLPGEACAPLPSLSFGATS